MSEDQDTVVATVPARLRFSGQPPAPAQARIAQRSSRWRTLGALRSLALWWALIPLVVWIPPHVPWVLMVGAIGAYRALSRYREARTLLALHGVCPKCGTEQDFPAGVPLRGSHKVTCAHCRWELKLETAVGPLPTSSSGTSPQQANR